MKTVKINTTKLRKALKDAKMMQIELADKINLNKVSVCILLKKGKTFDVTLEKIVKVLNKPKIKKIDEERHLIITLNKPYTFEEFIKN